jgi:hypothetical protein
MRLDGVLREEETLGQMGGRLMRRQQLEDAPLGG